MTSPQVVHHVDYRSKAEDRRRELEELQEKGLAKSKAFRLRYASAPTEACNFIEKQRELFATRRKKQADAVEFLHQYRADNELVLRKAAAARRGLGSKSYKYSARHNLTTRRWSSSPTNPEREQEPDAHSSVYSYAIYPTLIPNKHGSTVAQDTTSEELSPPRSPDNPPSIDQKSIRFESAMETLEIAAKEASRVPLPENTDDIGNENSETLFETTGALVEVARQALRCDDNVHSDGEEDESNEKGEIEIPLAYHGTRDVFNGESKESIIGAELDNENNHPNLILDGEIDFYVNREEERNSCVSLSEKNLFDGDLPNCRSELSVDVDDSSAVQFIPFEAFSKIGESLVMGSLSSTHSEDDGDDDEKTLTKVETDDDSIIPGESFMKLGASMMAKELLSSKDEEDEEEKQIPTREPLQSSMETSDMITTTGTASIASQPSTESRPLSVESEITEQTNNCTLDDTSCQSAKSLLDGDRLETDDVVIDRQFTNSRAQCDKQLKEGCQGQKPRNDQADIPKSADKDSNVHCEKSIREPERCSSVVEKQEHVERSLYSRVELGDDEFDMVRTPTKPNLTAEISGKAEPNVIDHISNTEDKSQGSDNEEPNVLDHINITEEKPQGREDEESNAVDRTKNTGSNEESNFLYHISNTKEKLQGSEPESSVNSKDTTSLSVRDETPRIPPNRKKKKKNDKSYYPSSGLFASRQFLSR